jgi:hypothetical protein
MNLHDNQSDSLWKISKNQLTKGVFTCGARRNFKIKNAQALKVGQVDVKIQFVSYS